MKTAFTFVLVASLVGLLSVRASAKRMQWILTGEDVVTSDLEAGTWVLRWRFPDRLTTVSIEYASLEARFDSSPWQEVKAPYTVTLVPIRYDSPGGDYHAVDGASSAAFIVSGGDDRASIDVTSVLRSWKRDGGMVFGLLATGGETDARPALMTGALAPGAVAILTVYTTAR